jgi:hypothetical protein
MIEDENRTGILTIISASDSGREFGKIYVDQLMNVQKARYPHNMNSIAYHKLKLGKQNRCAIYGHSRYWIWEGSNWAVVVGTNGANFEVSEDATLEEVKAAWNEYYSKII